MSEPVRLDLCGACYELTIVSVIIDGAAHALNTLEDHLGIPRGGLDKVVILRAEGPPRYEGAKRRWVQLRLCSTCGACVGEGEP